MANITIEEGLALFFKELPDGVTLTWEQILEKTGVHRRQIEGLAFGKPDSVSRSGYNYIARGAVSAEMKFLRVFKLHSEKTVTFSVRPTGDKVYVENITGISVKTGPVTLLTITEVSLGIDKSGNYALSTKGLTAVVNTKGELVDLKMG